MAQREGVWYLIERFQFESLYRENKNDKCNFATQQKNSHLKNAEMAKFETSFWQSQRFCSDIKCIFKFALCWC